MGSEILLIYEVKNANPNGDPGNSNYPRVNDEGYVEVTDLRIKRFIRDYIQNYVQDKNVAVRRVEEVHENSISALLRFYVNELRSQINNWDSSSDEEKEAAFLNRFIDIPLFGLVTGSEGEANSDINFLRPSYYGSVQFQYARSLNKPNIKDIDISTITGTLGKDYRIDYGIFTTWGVINQRIWENYRLDNNLLNDFDLWVINSINHISSESRSKIGHDVLLYMRIEYSQPTLPRDLTDFISISQEENINSSNDYTIDNNNLISHINGRRERISRIRLYRNEKLRLSNDFSNLNINLVENIQL